MENGMKLHYNRIKCENENCFETSSFRDVYKNAYFMVSQIIESNHKFYSNREKIEEYCNGNYVSNIVSFLGGRGMGKSSSMLSFAYHLLNYGNNAQESICDNNQELFKYKSNDSSFVKFKVLPKIDAAMFCKSESLFDVTLAMLLDWFKEGDDYLVGENFQHTHLKNSFGKLRDTYALYLKQFEENSKKEISTYSEFHNLKHVINLRNDFSILVSELLDYKYRDRKETYLVIPIDDLDLMNDSSYMVLEQIRNFFTIPRVILLVTADIERLALDIKASLCNMFINQNNSSLADIVNISEYRYDYLAKILPTNMRIYMPSLNEIRELDDINIESFKNYIFTKKVKIRGLEINKLVLLVFANKLHILVSTRNQNFRFISRSLRNRINFVDEMQILLNRRNSLNDSNSVYYQWFKKLIIVSTECIEDSELKKLYTSLWSLDDNQLNASIISFENIYSINGKLYNENYNESYSAVINYLILLQDNLKQSSLEIQYIIFIYSMRIQRILENYSKDNMENDKRELDFFTRGDIFSSMKLNAPYVLMFTQNIKKIIEFEFEYDIDNNNLKGSLRLEKNKRQIVDKFIMILFSKLDDFPEMQVELKKGNENKNSDDEATIYNNVKKETRYILHFTTNSSQQLFFSIDNFFNNISRAKKIWDKYSQWLRGYIGIYSDFDDEKIIKELKNSTNLDFDKFEKFNKKYLINNIYDIIPLQNVDVMIELFRTLRNNSKYSVRLKKDSIINNVMVVLDALCEVYSDVENTYYIDAMGIKDIQYKDKFTELRKALNLNELEYEKKIIPLRKDNFDDI